MSTKKKLEEVLQLVKRSNDEVEALKKEGKDNSEKLEGIVKDLFEKRRVAMDEDLVNRFRKGEHLSEPSPSEGGGHQRHREQGCGRECEASAGVQRRRVHRVEDAPGSPHADQDVEEEPGCGGRTAQGRQRCHHDSGRQLGSG